MGVLDGKAAIITGAGRGIGRATAELLVEHGAAVLVNDIDADAAGQAAEELEGTTAFAGDITAPGVAEELVASCVEAFGQLDIVVNNAGYTWDGVIHRMSDEQFQAMLDVHTVGPFRLLRAAAPHMRDVAKAEREAGREPAFRKVVNVSSISGVMGNAGQVNYAAGKAGLIGLTKTLAKEWGQFAINVNAVAFGFVETRLTAAKGEAGSVERGGQEIELGIPAQLRELAASTIPLGRPATPDEAAGAIFFLCSPWSNFVHGQVLNVTGGQIAGMTS